MTDLDEAEESDFKALISSGHTEFGDLLADTCAQKRIFCVFKANNFECFFGEL